MLAAHGHHRLRSPHARPSQRRAPFPTFRHSCVPLRVPSVIPASPPSFLRPLRHSCGGRNPGDLCGSRALPMFDGARSPAGLWWAVGRMEARRIWAVAWIPASAGMTDRAGVMARSPSTPKSARSTISTTCAIPTPPSFLRPLRHSCAPSVIPAEAGIQAICAGQGHSQCSTAPDHPRGSGGPSAGWRLVARLGGRMDSCLRRNDGQGGCDGGARSTPKSAARPSQRRAPQPSVIPAPPPSFLRIPGRQNPDTPNVRGWRLGQRPAPQE